MTVPTPATPGDPAEYFAVELATLRKDRPVDFDVFTKREGALTLYEEAGFLYDQARALGFTQHGIGEIYIRRADRSPFCRYVEAQLASLLVDVDLGTAQKAALVSGAAANLAREILAAPGSQTINRGRSLIVRVAGLVIPESEKLAETIRSAASDDELYQECVKIAIHCLAFADHLKLKSLKTLGELALAGFVANIGKSRLPARIRMSTTGLAARDAALVHRHAEMSMELVDRLIYPETRIGQGILLHHERHDGSGYPNGLSGQQIPITAQVVGLADLFDEISSQSELEGAAAAVAALKSLSSEYQGAFEQSIMKEFISCMGHLLM